MQCMDESKAPMIQLRREECMEWLVDYNECLHHEKEVNGKKHRRVACVSIACL